MDNMDLQNILTVSLPQFMISIPLIALLADGKRYMRINKLNILKYCTVLILMLVTSYFARRYSPNLFLSFSVQTIMFTIIFKGIYFRSKKISIIISGIVRFLVLQMALELVIVAGGMIFIGKSLESVLKNDLERFFFSLPITVLLLLTLIILWKYKDLKFLEGYKRVKNLSILVEILLLTCEILVIYMMLGFSSTGATAQRVVSIILLLILSSINILYIISLNLLSEEIYYKIYPRLISLREREGSLNDEEK